MEQLVAGDLVTVATSGPQIDGIVFDLPSPTKAIVALMDRRRGPVLRAVLLTWGSDGGELLANVVLGKVDALNFGALENLGADRDSFEDWYRLLDAGLQVPLAAHTPERQTVAAFPAVQGPSPLA